MPKLTDLSIAELQSSLAANERIVGPDAASTRAIRRVLYLKLAAEQTKPASKRKPRLRYVPAEPDGKGVQHGD